MDNQSKQPYKHPAIIIFFGYWFAASLAWGLLRGAIYYVNHSYQTPAQQQQVR